MGLNEINEPTDGKAKIGVQNATRSLLAINNLYIIYIITIKTRVQDRINIRIDKSWSIVLRRIP